VVAVFTCTVHDPGNIRRMPEYGGGSLADVGSHCVNVSRWMFGRAVVHAGSGGREELHAVEPEGVYRLEIEDFADCVLGRRAPEVVSHADTLGAAVTPEPGR
jgi:predicted dehydrogenase